MAKLKSIVIKGFKEADREVSLNFSETPITVIYGENGSGKTTFLKVIHAIFNKDEEYLIEENIKEIDLVYLNGSKQEKKLHINVHNKKVEWGENIKDLTTQTSILFGVNRGIIQGIKDFDFLSSDSSRILMNLRNNNQHSSTASVKRELMEIEYLISKIKRRSEFSEKDGNNSEFFKQNHISVDFISINEIENAIIKQYRAGQRAASDSVKNAFFNTISNAVEIEVETINYELPENFNERINEKREVLISLVEKLDKSSLQSRLLNFLKKDKTDSKIQDSRIFRAMLLNILKKVEEENIELKSISQLIEIFNNHLYRSKKLIVTDEEAHIDYNKGKTHSLDKLSSGERHLLTFLTLFLIIGRNRNFFIIDEPEISLNMKWQRELMPLLSEINPNAQIIVATHSPSIAHKNSNYLIELV